MKMAFNSVPKSSCDIGETDGPNSEYKLESFNKNNVCVDLSHASLSEFPFAKVVEPSHLQFLYLQGNVIEKLPNYFFSNFPSLRHLDLRQNRLLEIPVSIAGHNCLEVLLLQDNQLMCLPYEIGQVPRLRKLQISGNPLKWPPNQVISGGLAAILSYLRGAFMEKLSQRQDADVAKSNVFEENCSESTEEETEARSRDSTAQNWGLESDKPLETVCEIQDSSSTSGLLESYEKHDETGELVHQKGGTKQLKQHEPVNSVGSKYGKWSLFKPDLSSHQAQAVMNGQTFPLGYKKRCSGVSTSKICKTLLRQLWLNQLQFVLQSQDHVLQKQKSSEALRLWRQEAKELQHNCNTWKKWSGLDVPYDIDSQYMKMVSRSGWQMFQNESLEKRGHSKPHITCVKAMGLQERINHILQSFEDLRSEKASSDSKASDYDPSKQRKLLAEELKRIRDLQKAVQALRLSTL